MAKKASDIGKLTFEDALRRLEGIVEGMEEGDVPLEELVVQFQEGTKLMKHCSGKLSDAELKIQKLADDGEFESFEVEES